MFKHLKYFKMFFNGKQEFVVKNGSNGEHLGNRTNRENNEKDIKHLSTGVVKRIL